MSNVFFERRKKLLALRTMRAEAGKSDPKKEEVIICPRCGEGSTKSELIKSLSVCGKCGYHYPVGAYYRLSMIFDPGSFKEINEKITAKDALSFPKYQQKLGEVKQRTGLREAVVTATGRINGSRVAAGVIDTRFFMGSMSAAMGEKTTLLVEYAQRYKLPLIMFCAGGGARMQEGILSLMQMAKTSGAVKKFSEKGGFYIAVFTDPTTGGITASFASLGDITLAEPGALIGFAGPRVIEQTIGQKLPEGFQSSEYLEEHGFIDAIVPRGELKNTLSQLIMLHGKGGGAL